MNIAFDDNGLHKTLAPLTLTKPVCELRFGINTIRESWCELLNVNKENVSYRTENYLNVKFPFISDPELIIAGNIKPTKELVSMIGSLNKGEKLLVNEKWVASKGVNASTEIKKEIDSLLFFEKPWHIFQKADKAVRLDFDLITAGRNSAFPSTTNQLLGDGIFIEEGAKVECSILNAESGPIYIGKDAQIMEGSMIRGPFAMGENSVVKMGAKIYGATVLGQHCKVGGEITNSIFQAYSNKAHDGYMGNSLIGEWCNLGADTNTSNLKNNYSNVSVYSYESKKMEKTEVMFYGIIMGDHSKTGINTMLNTATSIGVSANIFDAGFPPKYIPSFSWGGHGEERFILGKAFEVARNMMKRRGIELSPADKKILTYLYQELA